MRYLISPTFEVSFVVLRRVPEVAARREPHFESFPRVFPGFSPPTSAVWAGFSVCTEANGAQSPPNGINQATLETEEKHFAIVPADGIFAHNGYVYFAQIAAIIINRTAKKNKTSTVNFYTLKRVTLPRETVLCD